MTTTSYGERCYEPEWMDSGPTDPMDTIELKGFDEDEMSECFLI
jgi:hypothetical protein